jgi:hypothetical protein
MVRTKFACGVLLVFAVLSPLRQTASAQKDGEAKPKRNEALRQELLGMMKADQELRMEISNFASPDAAVLLRIAVIDRKNIARMKEIIAKHGWPGKSLVGEDGAEAAWLLVQHADKDREFQKNCLTLLERAVKAREASAGELAYLTDRVRIGENEKQVYGTQFRLVDGKWQPYPIEDEKNVDQRRKEMGLSPLAEYRKKVEEAYKPQKK